VPSKFQTWCFLHGNGPAAYSSNHLQSWPSSVEIMLRSVVRTAGRPIAKPHLSQINRVSVGGGAGAGGRCLLTRPSSFGGGAATNKNVAVRCMSAYVLDSVGGGSLGTWPIRKMNTIFNIVPQGHKHVVERFGRLHNVVCTTALLLATTGFPLFLVRLVRRHKQY
jgi:hypothetical protein